MVNKIAALLIYVLSLTVILFGEEVKVVSEIDQGAYENEPIKGTVSITHNQKNAIDKESFLLGKNKLVVEFVKEVQIAPNDPLVLTIYSFKIGGQPQGLYALQPVSVRVGKDVYQSTMSSYNVEAKKSPPQNPQPSAQPNASIPTPPAQPASPPTQPSQQATAPANSDVPVKPVLRLQAAVEGNSSIYPGQRTKLVYYYYFTGDIALITEQLPLLDAKGLIKIGEKEFDNSVQGTESVNKISQQVEAVKPGKYSFGPSLIEGYAYKEDIPGQPVYTSEKLSSQAEPVEITVMPFPEKDKPASFNGADGKYTFKASLLSPKEMTQGDEISVGLEISGKGNLKNVSAPDLCCQPGFSGFFRLSDLPPSEEIDGDTKKITEKIRPLNAQIKSIPSIEFSSFDPETAQYSILHSEPISINVKPGDKPPGADNQADTPQPLTKPSDTPPKPTSVPRPIEIESIFPLKTCDLYNKFFGTWWSLAIIPFAILLLIYQSHLKDYLNWRRNQTPIVSSQELFLKSFSEEQSGKCDFDSLKHAFKLALVEAGLIPSADVSEEDLPSEGLSGEVKSFWSTLDEKRFAGGGAYDIAEVRQLSQNLMNKIHAVSNNKPQDLGAKL